MIHHFAGFVTRPLIRPPYFHENKNTDKNIEKILVQKSSTGFDTLLYKMLQVGHLKEYLTLPAFHDQFLT